MQVPKEPEIGGEFAMEKMHPYDRVIGRLKELKKQVRNKEPSAAERNADFLIAYLESEKKPKKKAKK